MLGRLRLPTQLAQRTEQQLLLLLRTSSTATTAATTTATTTTSKPARRTTATAPRLPLVVAPPTIDPATAPPPRHLLVALVDNEPGVLSKISGMFAGRNFNIDSLTVGRTDSPAFRRLTIVVRADQTQLAQLQRQLQAQVHVWSVVAHPLQTALERELLLLRVQVTDPARRLQLHQTLALHAASIVDVGPDALVASCVAHPDRLEALLRSVQQFALPFEIARSGSVAVAACWPVSPASLALALKQSRGAAPVSVPLSAAAEVDVNAYAGDEDAVDADDIDATPNLTEKVDPSLLPPS